MWLALDLGTNTGVVRGLPGAAPTSETWRLPSGGRENVGATMSAFEERLSAALEGVTLIAFEAPFLGRSMKDMSAARRVLGWPVIVEMLAFRRAIPVYEVNIASARKAFTGNGRAEKSEVMEWARRRGFNPNSDHEGDAFAVWYFLVSVKAAGQVGAYDPLFLKA